MKICFSDYFDVSEHLLDEYGAFNISLIADIPLFIDPFLLFNSKKSEYQALHNEIISYLHFLRIKSAQGRITLGLERAWYYFPEVKQNWFGFTKASNTGCGLGMGFADALNKNLVKVFKNFGEEKITSGSHLEKLCLISEGVGRDKISDFTTNLIKGYLLSYTERFAEEYISKDLIEKLSINHSYFDYKLERWMPKIFTLPIYEDDFIILTPKDMLTKDETWINKNDMIWKFEEIPNAMENIQLRAEINNYFISIISQYEEPTAGDLYNAKLATIEKYPQLIDYYIKMKEVLGDEAIASSYLKVQESYRLYIKQFGSLIHLLERETSFYRIPGKTKDETRGKILFFKDVIENKGGYKIFYGLDKKPIRREEDLHILFRLVWHVTPSDVSREVNDGMGPADYKITRGARDKTIIEFKLASNPKLKQNLKRQLSIYKKASDAKTGFVVIIFFFEEEYDRVEDILNELGMKRDKNIILVDARKDNKPSASKA